MTPEKHVHLIMRARRVEPCCEQEVVELDNFWVPAASCPVHGDHGHVDFHLGGLVEPIVDALARINSDGWGVEIVGGDFLWMSLQDQWLKWSVHRLRLERQELP